MKAEKYEHYFKYTNRLLTQKFSPFELDPTDDTFDCIVAMKTLNSGTTITLRLKQYRLNGNTIVKNPHNDFLLVFAETGIFGILCYLGLFATLL